MIRNTDEQPDEEIHRVRSGRVPSIWISLSVQLGCIALPVGACFTNLEALRIPTLGTFMVTSSHRHDQSLIPFSALLPFQENSRWGWKFQASNRGLVFPVTSPHPGAIQEPTQSHLIRTKDIHITQELTKVSGTLCQEPGSKTLISLRKSDGLQKLCARNWGQRPLCIFYYLKDPHILSPFFMPKLKIYPLCVSTEPTAFFTKLGLTIKIKHLEMYLLSSVRQKWTVIC